MNLSYTAYMSISRAEFIRSLDPALSCAGVQDRCVEMGFERPTKQAVYSARRYCVRPPHTTNGRCESCGSKLKSC